MAKDIVSRKKNICKINLFHQNKPDHQLLHEILVRFLRNSIKYIVSRVVSRAFSGAQKFALLTAMIIQSAF